MSPGGRDTWTLEKAVDSLHGVATFVPPTLYFSSAEDTGQQCAKSWQRVLSVRISEGCLKHMRPRGIK